ncbi:PTS lactose transporter subunit IIB [Brachybacterium endophyticum]|uniref:PTS lactose transporter subunit IIB n=1 Tax=Brachybacterium endophyticum TaxID=2182385 RepID=A0A2U2RLK7_9MICO|nr:PTS lactose transporter subunit IIB [Brachybacterium endophyticum]PWH06664.1 PTS lactose transporter subunit IIB [Brachybacterium endophyticum]
MRTIAVVSGSGVTASAQLARQMHDHLDRRQIQAHVLPTTVMDMLSQDFHADLIIATVEIPQSLRIPVISGMPLLLDTNPQLVFDDVERLLARPHPTRSSPRRPGSRPLHRPGSGATR